MPTDDEIYSYALKKSKGALQGKPKDQVIAYAKKKMGVQDSQKSEESSMPYDTPSILESITNHDVLPTIGMGVGAAIGAPLGRAGIAAGAGLGAAGGEGLGTLIDETKNILQNKKIPNETIGGVIRRMIEQGIGATAGEGATKLVGKGVEAVTPGLKKLGTSYLEHGPGLTKKAAELATQTPSRLWANVKDAGKKFGEWIGTSGFKEDRATKYIGTATPGPQQIEKFVDAVEHLEKYSRYAKHIPGAEEMIPKGTLDDLLLTAREQLARKIEGIEKPIAGNTTDVASDVTFWRKRKKAIDTIIEERKPGYAKIRNDYANKETQDAFNHMLPLEKQGTQPSAIKTGVMMGAIGEGANLIGKGDFVSGGALMAGGALMSPKVAGLGLKGLAHASNMIRYATMAQLPQSAIRHIITSFAEKATPKELEKLQQLVSTRMKESKQPNIDLSKVSEDPLGLMQ